MRTELSTTARRCPMSPARCLLRRAHCRRFGDPLRTGPGSYYEWLNEAVDGEPNAAGNGDPAVARGVSRPARSAERVPGLSGADRDAFLALDGAVRHP